MTSGGKSLTTPPENLKEAVDWVIHISELKQLEQLAAALEALLKHDGSEVAVRVKEVYEKICEKFCNISDTLDGRPAPALKYYLKNLETFEPVKRSGDEGDGNILRKFRDGSVSLETSISTLAENLKTFLGANEDGLTSFTGQGIIKTGGTSSYNPAYNGAQWSADEAEQCAVILLAVVPMIFLALNYIHPKCKDGIPLSALVNPSFGSPCNLKEAIDWILRVTGKDGQGGRDNTSVLAKAVKELLESAVRDVESLTSNRHKNDTELQKLKTGLEKAKELVGQDVTGDTDFEYVGTGGPIGMLAEGLQKFIGYGSKGILSDPPTAGKLTGAGIAPSNMATHRLCDAAIAFTNGVLEGCKKYSDLTNTINSQYLQKVEKNINDLYSKYGIGPGELKNTAKSVGDELKRVNGSNVGQFIVDIGKAFETLKSVTNTSEDVATKVGAYLKGVFAKKWTNGNDQEIGDKIKAIGTALNSTNVYNLSDLGNLIKQVDNVLDASKAKLQRVKDSLNAGKSALLDHLRKYNYTSRYQDYEPLTEKEVTPTHAKIFLACLPLFYQAFTYIYWRCDTTKGNGAWAGQNFGDDKNGWGLKDFMFAMHCQFGYLNNRRGSDVVETVKKSMCKDFETVMSTAKEAARTRASAVIKAWPKLYPTASSPSPSEKPTYPEFLRELQKKFPETLGASTPAKDSLAAMYYCALCYFKCQQSKNVTKAVNTPSTIREMLYYLAALPFSPNYNAFNIHVTAHFKKLSPVSDQNNDAALMIPVADSGISSKHNTLSATDIKDYLTSTCMYSMSARLASGPGGVYIYRRALAPRAFL
ncbi:variant erythrocyte surface antigen-1 family protein [Babesia caballi]|uniref:Variant erythrocyte surface antigen-1 family protein n=1 Tax=Babesia caballi TaxID=5871 RepID=A0AAV4LQ34_BABCB|nr:variant erythrocyte surface antigen-1 family protein [Babesia caballi]